MPPLLLCTTNPQQIELHRSAVNREYTLFVFQNVCYKRIIYHIYCIVLRHVAGCMCIVLWQSPSINAFLVYLEPGKVSNGCKCRPVSVKRNLSKCGCFWMHCMLPYSRLLNSTWFFTFNFGGCFDTQNTAPDRPTALRVLCCHRRVVLCCSGRRPAWTRATTSTTWWVVTRGSLASCRSRNDSKRWCAVNRNAFDEHSASVSSENNGYLWV